MDSASDIPGSPVAWNGVFLTVPKDWTPATIEPRYISFTRNATAALECKWSPETGVISLPRKRKALERQMKRAEGFTFAPEAVPPHWLRALERLSADFETLPFAHALGTGALCLHRPSNTSLLLHCYIRPDEPQHDLHAVLASLGVSVPGTPVPFAIHDMQFSVPAGYALEKAEFNPGNTCLRFSRDRCTLTVQRLTPANVVLQGQPFRAWIQETQDVPLSHIRKDKTTLPQGAHKRYLWRTTPRPSLLQRLSCFRNGLKSARAMQGTAWVADDENKLLLVTHESATTNHCDEQAFRTVWQSVRVF